MQTPFDLKNWKPFTASVDFFALMKPIKQTKSTGARHLVGDLIDDYRPQTKFGAR